MSTTSRCPACTTPASCAARTRAAQDQIRSISSQRCDFPGVAAVFTGKDTEKVGPGAVRRLPARPARSASSHPGDGSRLLRRPSGGGSGRDRSLHRRAMPPTPIEVDYEPLPAVADPEKAHRARRARRASGMARQHGLHLSPGRRRRRQSVRRSRRGGEAAHHQPAPDPDRPWKRAAWWPTGVRATKR